MHCHALVAPKIHLALRAAACSTTVRIQYVPTRHDGPVWRGNAVAMSWYIPGNGMSRSRKAVQMT